ncbi:MAG TPA: NUDIX hydrolase [Rudaea sp.]|nr:NUDIX hydrolase [Rudaea sp.]
MNQTISENPNAHAIWRPDVTVACVVPRDGRFLFVEENIRGDRVLNQPAGHLEPNETLLAAALRETREETGWTVTLTDLIGVYQWTNRDGDRHFLRFAFAAQPTVHDPRQPLDVGIERAVWLTRDEIAAAPPQRLRSPMVLRNIDDWLAGQRFPLDVIGYL